MPKAKVLFGCYILGDMSHLIVQNRNCDFLKISSITFFNKEFTVTRLYVFRYDWESTTESLPRSQSGIGKLILNIILWKT